MCLWDQVLNSAMERMSVSCSMLEGNATACFRGIVATDMVAQQAPNKRYVILKDGRWQRIVSNKPPNKARKLSMHRDAIGRSPGGCVALYDLHNGRHSRTIHFHNRILNDDIASKILKHSICKRAVNTLKWCWNGCPTFAQISLVQHQSPWQQPSNFHKSFFSGLSGYLSKNSCERFADKEPEACMTFPSRNKKNNLATTGFDPVSSGLWARRASAAPRCCAIFGRFLPLLKYNGNKNLHFLNN